MGKNSRRLLTFVSILLLAGILLVPLPYGCAAPPESRRVFIPELPEGTEQMNPNFFVSSTILNKIFPDLKKAREPSIDDIGDATDRYHFVTGGFAFVLFDDFNGDGLLDVALVGKYDDIEVGIARFFFAIVSVEHKTVSVQYFQKLGFERVLLQRVPKLSRDNYSSIFRVYAFETERCDYLFWNGKEFVTRPCSQMNR